jgi:hypothetical protein
MRPIFSPAICQHNSLNSHNCKIINAQPTNPQAVVYNINNTNGNNYVNCAITATTTEATRVECPQDHAECQREACALLLPTLDAQNNVTRLTDTAHPTSHNYMGFNQVNNSVLDSDNHSTNKTLANEDAATETNPSIQPHRSAQFRIPVKTSKDGVVALHGKLVPYLKSSLNVAHLMQYWSYYAHILQGNNLSVFPALTEDNIQYFIDRMNLICQEVLSIGKGTFEAEIVSAFNRSGHTIRGQPITCM